MSSGYQHDKYLFPIVKRLQSDQRSSFHDKYTLEDSKLFLVESDRLRLCIPFGDARLNLNPTNVPVRERHFRSSVSVCYGRNLLQEGVCWA